MSTSPLQKRPNDGSVSPPPSKRPFKQLSTTTKQAVASFFTPASQKEKMPEKISWQIIESTLIVGKYNAASDMDTPLQSGKRKVAAFDFDSTLISTISKSQFARNAEDWCWWHGSVPAKLKQLQLEGFTIIIVSNQAGISLSPTKGGPKIVKSDKVDRYTAFKKKATAVFNSLNLPITLYAATAKDKYRKPSDGMWQQFLQDYGLKQEDIDHDESVFVGDAAGRLEGKVEGRVVKKDFSCSDRNLAANIGIQFKTPEEFFLNEAPREFVRSFETSAYLLTDGSSTVPFAKSESAEILLFVGFPGSGKSTFFREKLQPLGYERVNQDTLKSRDNCVKHAVAYLKEGKSIAIDNTNPDREVRHVWTSLAKKFNVPIRCIHFTANRELAKHNSTVRGNHAIMNPEARYHLPEMAFNTFNKRYQMPMLDEGFSELISLNFSFEGSAEQRKVWAKYSY